MTDNKYFVHGCTDDGECCERVSDEDAQFWTVYRRNEDGTSEAQFDCVTREDAKHAVRMLTNTPAH